MVVQKTLTRIIGEGAIWTTASTLIVKVVSLLTIFITLRALTVYEYGVAELVIAAVGFFSIFQLPGLASVVVADMGVLKGKGDIAKAKGIYWSFLKLSGVMAALASAVLFFGAEAIASFYPEHIAGYFRILAFTFPLSVVGTAYGALFSVTFRYSEQSVSSFLQEFFKLIILSVCIFVFDLKVEAILLGMIGGQAFTFLVQFPSALRAYRSLGNIPPISYSMWRTIYEHGKWSVFSTYLGSFGNNIRTYIIKVFLGTEAVAVFAVAVGLIGHTSALVPIGNVVTPIIPQYISDKARFLRIISKAIKYQVIGYVLIGFFALFVFPPIIVWMFPKYEIAMPLYRVMLFSLIPLGIMSVFTTIFFAYKAQKSLFFAVVLKTVYFSVFTGLFAWWFGISGVAYAYILTVFLYTIERYRQVKKLVPAYRFSFKDLVSFDELDRVILGKFRVFVCTRLFSVSKVK